MVNNKRGSIFIEASMVVPLTCLIVIGIIILSIGVYNNLNKQVKIHKEALIGWTKSESDYVWEIINPKKN